MMENSWYSFPGNQSHHDSGSQNQRLRDMMANGLPLALSGPAKGPEVRRKRGRPPKTFYERGASKGIQPMPHMPCNDHLVDYGHISPFSHQGNPQSWHSPSQTPCLPSPSPVAMLLNLVVTSFPAVSAASVRPKEVPLALKSPQESTSLMSLQNIVEKLGTAEDKGPGADFQGGVGGNLNGPTKNCQLKLQQNGILRDLLKNDTDKVSRAPTLKVCHCEECLYLKKVQSMSKYIEPMRAKLAGMSEENFRLSRKTRILLELLTNPEKRVPLNILDECEQSLNRCYPSIR